MDTLSEIVLPWPEDREVWREVPGYRCYEVSTSGRVRSFRKRGPGSLRDERREKCVTIKPAITAKGYARVSLTSDEKAVQLAIHRLVLLAFVGPAPQAYLDSRHLDGNPLNNSINNLCWGTKLENGQDRVRHETAPKGTRHWNAKLGDDDVREIRAMRERGASLREMATAFGISEGNVLAIVQRKTWRHVA